MESHARLDAADAAGVLPENAARDATLGKTIRAFRIIGAVGVRLSGVKAKHVFYEWRALAHDARSARARTPRGRGSSCSRSSRRTKANAFGRRTKAA